MNIKRKLGNLANKIGNQFAGGKDSNVNKLVRNVGSQALSTLGQVSNGLDKTGNVLDKINKYAGTALNNPMAQAIGASNPFAAKVLQGLQQGNQLVGAAGNASHQLSGMTDKSSYSGNTKQVLGQILEKAKGVKAEAKANTAGIQFA